MQSKGVQVHNGRFLSGHGDDVALIIDGLSFDRHQDDIGFAAVLRGPQEVVVQIHLSDVKRDVLLRFPVNRFSYLGRTSGRQRYSLDDDRRARDGTGNRFALDLPRMEDMVDGVCDGLPFGYRPIHYRTPG